MCKQSKELRLFNFQYLSVVVFPNTILLPEQTMLADAFITVQANTEIFFLFQNKIEAKPNRWSGIKRAQNKSKEQQQQQQKKYYSKQ